MTLPATRGDCPSERPCPHRRCRHHLLVELERTHRRARMPPPELDDLEHSCALDLADQNPGGLTLDAVAQVFGCTRERVRQIQGTALAHMARKLGRFALDVRQHLRDRDALPDPVPTCGAPFVDEPTEDTEP